jgi:hypothetical protein
MSLLDPVFLFSKPQINRNSVRAETETIRKIRLLSLKTSIPAITIAGIAKNGIMYDAALRTDGFLITVISYLPVLL